MSTADLAELVRLSPPPDWWYDEDFTGIFADDEPKESDCGISRQGMGRRVMKSGEEQDVHTGWRRLMVGMDRAGITDRVKRRARRRERREAKRGIA